jgi:hypothetical protein
VVYFATTFWIGLAQQSRVHNEQNRACYQTNTDTTLCASLENVIKYGVLFSLSNGKRIMLMLFPYSVLDSVL